ncbi:MAG: DUF4214 domain-containing protein, partial [Pseudomonadota bacterium]
MSTPTSSSILVGLYDAFFLRAPDEAGYTSWVAKINAGTTLNSISKSFFDHPYASTTLGYAGMTLDAYVSAIYKNILNGTGGQVPTQPEIDYWKTYITN